MLIQLRRSRFGRYAAVPALIILTSGCHKWVDIELGPRMPDRVRVSTTRVPTQGSCPEGYSRFEVDQPRLVDGHLHHLRSHNRPIPVASICKVEQQVSDAGATALAIVGGIAGLLLVGLAVYAATDPCLGITC